MAVEVDDWEVTVLLSISERAWHCLFGRLFVRSYTFCAPVPSLLHYDLLFHACMVHPACDGGWQWVLFCSLALQLPYEVKPRLNLVWNAQEEENCTNKYELVSVMAAGRMYLMVVRFLGIAACVLFEESNRPPFGVRMINNTFWSDFLPPQSTWVVLWHISCVLEICS